MLRSSLFLYVLIGFVVFVFANKVADPEYVNKAVKRCLTGQREAGLTVSLIQDKECEKRAYQKCIYSISLPVMVQCLDDYYKEHGCH